MLLLSYFSDYHQDASIDMYSGAISKPRNFKLTRIRGTNNNVFQTRRKTDHPYKRMHMYSQDILNMHGGSDINKFRNMYTGSQDCFIAKYIEGGFYDY